MTYARYSVFAASLILSLLVFAASFVFYISSLWSLIPLAFFCLGIYDKLQKKHSILRNYPILGHIRYLIEYIRPEMRQYLVESDTEEVPFSRAQRAVVYQRSKLQVDSQAFGTKIDVMRASHEWMIHSMQPSTITSSDFRITVGPERKQSYSMSVFNISAMSFGALSANAIRALNLGAKMGNFAHDTGEGSVSAYHLENGGDLIFQVASGYFGCRNPDGTFSEEKFKVTAAHPQIRMIEVKLSQGAKPGHGGVLPAAKITQEIAVTRGVPMGIDCISPSSHSSFSTPIELLQFIQKLRNLSDDKPVGIKFCVGQPWEFFAVCKAMIKLDIYPDFIVVDGAEGGTGAAPLEFTDHIGTPLQEGLLLVHNTLTGLNIRHKIKIGASGKIITAFDMARIFALGADWVNSARGFMFSLGCVQALSCNTGTCPSGIATQDPERQKALVVPEKAQRVYNFHHSTLHALQELLQATGVQHPSELKAHHIMKRLSAHQVALLADTLPFLQQGDLLNQQYRYPVFEKYWEKSQAESFKLTQ